MFSGLFRKRTEHPEGGAEALYAAIVAAARRPGLYSGLGAPDTLPGRFELIVLHAALVMRRLRREGDPAALALAQATFDEMCARLDDNLREIGVGDITVPKRMKALARSFYDGARAYDDALDRNDRDALARALDKNVYAGDAPAQARRLAGHAFEIDAALGVQPVDRLVADGPEFPAIDGDEA